MITISTPQSKQMSYLLSLFLYLFMYSVLFIMLCGMPPFERAVPGDWWFNAISLRRYDRFWAAHFRSAPHMQTNTVACDLINKMLVPSPTDRLTLEQVAGHHWFDGQFLSPAELTAEMETKRDAREAVQAQEKARKAQERAQLIADRGAGAARQRTFDAFACDTTRAVGKPPAYNKDGSPVARGPYSVIYSSSDGMDLLLFIRRALNDLDAGANISMDAAAFKLGASLKVGGKKDVIDGEEVSLPAYSVAVDVQIFSAPEEEGAATEATVSSMCFAEISRKEGDFFGFRELVQMLKASVETQEQCQAEEERKGHASTVFGAATSSVETEEILQDDMGMV
jgi:hypothetical protein